MPVVVNKEPFSETGSFASLLRAAARVSGAEAESVPLSSGQVLHGRFQILDTLGSGGMGVVYRARDLTNRVELALKTLRRIDPQGLVRFKREFRSLADVLHPNLVLLHDLVRDGDLWFFTMELVDGAPFGSGAPLRPTLTQLVDGVSALHAMGWVHNDLKPSNVLVTPAGRVVVLDFGLVGDFDPSLRSPGGSRAGAALAGTPAYMAPEQTMGRSAGPATDWFAVGVMLFEHLTGRLPWDGPAESMLLRRRTYRAPLPSSVASDVPRDLDDLCGRLLAPDPEMRPSAEDIRARLGLVDEARSGTQSSFPVRAEVFVGRRGELSELRALLDVSGGARIVHVRGPSGIGKSTLARHLIRMSKLEGFVALRGRCHTRESVPFAALDAFVEHLSQDWPEHLLAIASDEADALHRAFPVLDLPESGSLLQSGETAGGPNEQLRQRELAARGLRKLIRAAAQERPLLLWIDDFQWVDRDSAWLLGEVLCPPHAPRVVVLLTSRDDVPPKLMDEASAAGRVPSTALELGPLTSEAAHEMAEALLVPSARGRAASIAAESSGHPFFLEMLARSDAEHLDEEDALPTSLDSAVRLRISRLDPADARVLHAVAVAGHPLSVDVASRAVGATISPSTLRTLCAGSFLRVSQNQCIEAYHDRIREVVYESLEAEPKAIWHGSVARALEGTEGSRPDVMAHHFYLAGQVSTARRYALEGAHIANRALAFDRAAELFGWVRVMGSDENPEGRELAIHHAEALFHARRFAEAAESFLNAARCSSDAVEITKAEQRAVASFFIGGHVRRGLAILEPLLERAGVSVPQDGAARRALIMAGTMRLLQRGFHFTRAAASAVDPAALARIDLLRTAAEAWSSLDPPRATAYLLEAAPLVLDRGEEQRVGWVFCQVGLFLSSLGQEEFQAHGARLLHAAGEMAGELRSLSLRAAVDLGLARAAVSLGKCREGVRLAEVCLGHAERGASSPHVFEVAQTLRLYGLLACGEINRLGALVPALLVDAERRNDAYLLVTVRLYAAHLRLVCDGDAAGAMGMVDRALLEWDQPRILFQTWLAVRTRVLAALYAGDASAASSTLDEAWPWLESSALLALGVVRPDALRLRGIVAFAKGGASGRVVGEQTYAMLSGRRPDEAAIKLTILATCVVQDGQPEEAAHLFGRAKASFRLAGRRLDASVAEAAQCQLRGAAAGRALERLRRSGVGDPARWVATMSPFVPRE